MYDTNSGRSAFKFHRLLGIERIRTKSSASQLKQDVFDLGSLLFISALGGLEIIDPHDLEHISEQVGCCILHYEEEKSAEKNTETGLLKIPQYFNSDRYSREFLDFLCKCLRFSEDDRASLDDLLNHTWLMHKETYKTASVTLKELIQISNQWRQVVPLTECQGPVEKQLERVCEAMAAVLPC